MTMTPLNYKAPRDPNTKSVVEKVRDVAESERVQCQVGSGECSNLAVEAQDDGSGGLFFVCRDHLSEVYAFGKLVAEMTPFQMSELDRLITSAEGKQ